MGQAVADDWHFFRKLRSQTDKLPLNIQEAEEFKTSKFYCKTDFDMAEISKEESEYVPLPKFYSFPSKEARERVLYANFLKVNQDIKDMIRDIQQYKVKK